MPVAAAEVPNDSVNVPRSTFPEVIVSVEFTIVKVLMTNCGLVAKVLFSVRLLKVGGVLPEMVC